MSVSPIRNVLRGITAVIATLLLATAVPHGLVPGMAAPGSSADAIARAELGRCMAAGRDTDECLDEADGKALVERAEWLARDDAATRQASRR